MSDYLRTTQECPVSQLRPELLRAIENYFQANQLGDLQTEAIMCCETISRKKSTGWLLSWLQGQIDTTIYTGMLLTHHWLIWVRSGDLSGLGLTAASLVSIQVRIFTSAITKDTGLEVIGYIGDSPHRVRGYIGMGKDPATLRFGEAVQQAITKLNPTSNKGIFPGLAD